MLKVVLFTKRFSIISDGWTCVVGRRIWAITVEPSPLGLKQENNQKRFVQLLNRHEDYYYDHYIIIIIIKILLLLLLWLLLLVLLPATITINISTNPTCSITITMGNTITL